MAESEMTSELVDLIHTLCGLCQERNRLMYKQLKINEKEFEFFMRVGEFSNLSIKKIAVALNLPQSNISRIIDKLVNKGLLERYHQYSDSRIVTISYTIRGKTKYAYAYKNKCLGNETIKSILKEKKYQEFKGVLQQIVANYTI